MLIHARVARRLGSRAPLPWGTKMIKPIQQRTVVLAVVTTLAWGASSTPGQVDEASRPVPTGHWEQPNNPPGVPARAGTAAAGRSSVTYNGYTSVQVNVNAAGQNIVGDAANEPTLAIDPLNPQRIVVGWRQFDTVASDFREAGWAYSHDGGQTWTFPGVLENGVFRSDPVIDVDTEGNFYYYSLTRAPNDTLYCDLFQSTDGGVTWPRKTSAWGGDKQWFVIDRIGGGIYASWSGPAGSWWPKNFTRSFDGGLTFETPYEMPLTVYGTLAVGTDETVYVGGRTAGVAPPAAVTRCLNARNPVLVPTFQRVTLPGNGQVYNGALSNPGGLGGQLYVGVDRSGGALHGTVYALGALYGRLHGVGTDVWFFRSVDDGVTWSAPVAVNDDPSNERNIQWFAALGVAPDGRLDVVWNDTRGGPRPCSSGNTYIPVYSRLYYAYSRDGGLTWSSNIAVSPPFPHFVGYPGNPPQRKLGDYLSIVSDEAVGNVAYAATFNDEQDVYFLRVGDCDGDGIHDGDDIALDPTRDLDGNGQLDQCEADCNNNGLADGYDILTTFSRDCNANAVPDECDIAADSVLDCDGNGRIDTCEIADGSAIDCDSNGRIDACEVEVSPVRYASAWTGTSWAVSGAPPAAADVTISVSATGDPLPPGQGRALDIDGVTVAYMFVATGQVCGYVTQDQVTIPADAFNNLNADGQIMIQCASSGEGCMDILCSSRQYTLEYLAAAVPDVNGDGIPDTCQCVGDVTCDHAVTFADIDTFVAALGYPGGIGWPHDCPWRNADCNGDGAVTFADIDPFVSRLGHACP